ncbi:MAG: hypothetical protein NTX26_02920 [Candidatus Parcubacteria bacterium]|nr:hypothetical protein [Candidatus Parcubacteria bacterium]
MRQKVIVAFMTIIFLLCCIPVSIGKLESIPQPFLIPPLSMAPNTMVALGENRSSEYAYQNWSFEYLTESHDVFSDIYGKRPYPWGGEIFEGQITFLSNKDGYSGKRSFQIEGKTISSHGAIAVPDMQYKPEVQPTKLYYLGCWVKYNITDGNGLRLAQQFFLPDDSFYPTYTCYGKWLTGKSNGWVYLGLLTIAPLNAYKGDPVIELWGKGTVSVDEVYFGPVEVKEVPPGGMT